MKFCTKTLRFWKFCTKKNTLFMKFCTKTLLYQIVDVQIKRSSEPILRGKCFICKLVSVDTLELKLFLAHYHTTSSFYFHKTQKLRLLNLSIIMIYYLAENDVFSQLYHYIFKKKKHFLTHGSHKGKKCHFLTPINNQNLFWCDINL